MEAVKVGKRGTIVVPAKLQKRYGIEEGALVTTEPREDGVLIRLAVVFFGVLKTRDLQIRA